MSRVNVFRGICLYIAATSPVVPGICLASTLIIQAVYVVVTMKTLQAAQQNHRKLQVEQVHQIVIMPPAKTIGIAPVVKSVEIMTALVGAIMIGIVGLQRNVSTISVKEGVQEIAIAENPLRFAMEITHVLSVP